MQAKTRVLVALMPDFIEAVAQAASSRFHLTFATSLQQAQSLLGNERFHAIACGTHFDGCRMFDLLRHVKSNLRTQGIPFVCVRAVGGTMDQTLEGVEIATRALGAAGFVDLYRLTSEFGQPQAFNKLRNFIEQLARGHLLEI